MALHYPESPPVDQATQDRTWQWWRLNLETEEEKARSRGLLDEGICAEAHNDGGRTALHRASILYNAEAVNTLIGQGMEVDVRSREDLTPLHVACFPSLKKQYSTEALEALLAYGAEVDARDNEGNTPLSYAATYGLMDAMRILVDKGADVHTVNKEGETLLHKAVQNGEIEVTDFLLGHDVAVNARNREGNTALHLAAKKPEEIRLAETLLAHGASIDAVNVERCTPLHYAAGCGHAAIVKKLLEQGAEVDARNRRGLTPLIMASVHGDAETIHILADYGADVEAQNNQVTTPLREVIWSGKSDAARALIKHGANVYAFPEQRPSGWLDRSLYEGSVKPLEKLYADFVKNRTPPESAWQVYQLLSVVPLTNPTALVDRLAHLRQIFRHAQWKNPAQAQSVLSELREHGESALLCASLQALISPSPQAAPGRSR